MRRICIAAAVIILPVFIVSCASIMPGTAPNLDRDDVRIIQTGQGKLLELPKGLRIDSVLETTLSSTRSRAGDKLVVRTTEPVLLDGKPIIPTGTLIYGKVAKITPPKYKLIKAKIDIAFDSIVLGGRTYPFTGETSLDKSAMAMKGAKEGGKYAAKEAAKRMVPGLGYVFLAMDAKKGYDYVTSDKEVVLERGTPFVIKLKERATIPFR